MESKEGVPCDEYERRLPLDTWTGCASVWGCAARYGVTPLMHDDDRCIAVRWGGISTWNEEFLCISNMVLTDLWSFLRTMVSVQSVV